MRYQEAGTPLVILTGKEYGTGSSRDWAAKGPALLGVKADHRRELRADPPEQPGGHGGAAAGLSGGLRPEVAGPHRDGDDQHHRHRRGADARRDRDGDGAGRGRQGDGASRRSSGSTRRWSSTTTGTGAFCSGCCGSSCGRADGGRPVPAALADARRRRPGCRERMGCPEGASVPLRLRDADSDGTAATGGAAVPVRVAGTHAPISESAAPMLGRSQNESAPRTQVRGALRFQAQRRTQATRSRSRSPVSPSRRRRSARSRSWRIRSRVTPIIRPISSSVRLLPSSRPK